MAGASSSADGKERGDPRTKVVWAGEAVDLIDGVLPAGTIVEKTVAEAVAMLTKKKTYALI